MSAAEQMEMEMVHRLAAILSGVDDHAIASIQLLPSRNLCCHSHEVPQQRSVLGQRLRLRRDVLFGNNQQVRRRLRIDIGKTDAEFILMHSIGGDGSGDDFAEQAV